MVSLDTVVERDVGLCSLPWVGLRVVGLSSCGKAGYGVQSMGMLRSDFKELCKALEDIGDFVMVLASRCTSITYVSLYDILLVTVSKCQPQWHMTVSNNYIKWTAFLVTVVACIPLRQSYFDYD